jgi:uncharacterized membrane protein
MKRGELRATIVRGLLIAVGALPLVPRLLARTPAADLFMCWFRFQCQRDPARTLSVFGQALPVCARCSGIYLGAALGALILRPRLEPRELRLWLAVASALMLADVLSEVFALRPAWAPLRVVSGALLSYPVGAALVHAARKRWPGAPEPTRLA